MGLCDLTWSTKCHAMQENGQAESMLEVLMVNVSGCFFFFFKFYFEIGVVLEKSYKNNSSLVPLTQHPPCVNIVPNIIQ